MFVVVLLLSIITVIVIVVFALFIDRHLRGGDNNDSRRRQVGGRDDTSTAAGNSMGGKTKNTRRGAAPEASDGEEIMVNTLWTIENETRPLYDSDRTTRKSVEVGRTAQSPPSPPHYDKLVHYNCEHFKNVSAQLAVFVGDTDMVSFNVLDGRNPHGYRSDRPICSKMIEFRTARELMAVTRSKFIVPAPTAGVGGRNRNNVAHYCSSPQDMRGGEKAYDSMMADRDVNYDYDARMTVCCLERLSDGRTFYYAHFVQEFKQTADNRESYLQIVRAINTLVERHGDMPLIFTGTFNVRYHYDVFVEHFDPKKYHICDFTHMPTTLGGEHGPVSSDGLVVSKDLYERVEYHTDFNSGCTNQISSLVVHAKMYERHIEPGTFRSKHWPLCAVTARAVADAALRPRLSSAAAAAADDDGTGVPPRRSYTTNQLMARAVMTTAVTHRADHIDTSDDRWRPSAPIEHMGSPPAYDETVKKKK